MKKRNILFNIIIIILLGIFIFSSYKIVSYFVISKREEKAFEELSSIANENLDTSENSEVAAQLEKLKILYNKNNDLFGWISIENTKIDYPVMYTPDDEEFYLHKSFEKKYSKSGVPFLSAGCFENCGNYILYGHNMKNGSMFATILKYKNKDFWKNNKIIEFYTLSEIARYEVFAAFYSKADPNEKFKYNTYTDLTDPTRFEEFISKVNQVKLYDTGTDVNYGDQLLTLSTCAYHTENGRFVVVAKKCK